MDAHFPNYDFARDAVLGWGYVAGLVWLAGAAVYGAHRWGRRVLARSVAVTDSHGLGDPWAVAVGGAGDLPDVGDPAVNDWTRVLAEYDDDRALWDDDEPLLRRANGRHRRGVRDWSDAGSPAPGRHLDGATSEAVK